MPATSARTAQLFERLIAGDPRLQARKMFGQPAAFVNGNLCVGVFGSDIFVRLSERDALACSRIPGVRKFEPMAGRPMRQYLILPPELLRKKAVANEWFTRAIDYVLTLPPK